MYKRLRNGDLYDTRGKIIEHLKTEKMLSVGELDCLLTTEDTETVEKLKAEARMAAQSVYGKQIYIRGLIEFTNYCKMTAITAASAGQCMCRALPSHRGADPLLLRDRV